MSNLVPGRPRRQQAYRRTNTSLGLVNIPAENEPDPYISCSNILEKFNGTSSNMANGSPLRKSSTGIKDFLAGRGSAKGGSHKESSSHHTDHASGSSGVGGGPDLVPQWSVQESVIDDLRISNIPRQPKYSYLIGKAAQKDDFWRKSNASNIVNNNQYTRPPPPSSSQDGAAVPNSSSYFLPQHNSSSSKRLNDFHSSTTTHNNSGTNATNNVQSAAYEDRINTALRKAPSGSAGGAAATNSVSSAVQKSKSYSNFDFVRRDLNFQVCKPTTYYSESKATTDLRPYKTGCTGVV